jgi:hypothetical protein
LEVANPFDYDPACRRAYLHPAHHPFDHRNVDRLVHSHDRHPFVSLEELQRHHLACFALEEAIVVRSNTVCGGVVAT